MSKLQDPYFWFFILTGMIWMYRARVALTTLKKTPTLERPTSCEECADLVTVVIPAKNEEDNIERCVKAFLAQEHKHVQILVANDSSDDRTEEILKSLNIPLLSPDQDSSTHPAAYINVPPTPEGWTGKNFAIHSAIPLARGKWFLFTDADTYHEPWSISSALSHMKANSLSFMTLVPRCITKRFLEHLIQPLAMCFLGLWFPMEKVNDPNSSIAFGNGQYIFTNQSFYKKSGGHKAVKGEFLEDYALMKKAKELKVKFQSAFGIPIFGTHMYDSLDRTWRGWRRIYLHAFEKNRWDIISRFAAVILFSILPFTIIIPFSQLALGSPESFGFSWGFACAIIIFIIVTSWRAYAMVRAKQVYALLHPIAAFFIALILLDAFWMAATKQKTQWR